MNMSASDLIKKSSMAICYFRMKKKEFPVTARMKEGVYSQERKTISELKEMRGTYSFGDILLHYCFDEIQEKSGNSVLLVEHKNITIGDIVEDWYIHYSILQTAFYHALASVNPSKKYYTAKFFRKQGYNINYIDLEGKNLTSILYIGEEQYAINPKNPRALVEFYISKAKHTFDYDSARYWDAQWKFKEWEHLKKYIKFTKIKHNEHISKSIGNCSSFKRRSCQT